MAPARMILTDRVDDTLANRSTLELLRWMVTREQGPELLVARHDGELAPELAALTDLRIVNEQAVRRPSRVLQVAHLHRPAEALRSRELAGWLRGPSRPTLLADVRATTLLHWVRPPLPPIVAMVSAAEPDRLNDLSADELAMLRRSVRGWIAGSEAAEQGIRSLVEGSEVIRHPDLLPSSMLDPSLSSAGLSTRRAEIRALLARDHGVGPDGPLVVGIGARDWWRTGNPFVEVVWRLRQHRPDVQAAWIALDSTDRMLWPLHHDLDHAGLGSSVAVLRRDPPPMEVLTAADLCLDIETGPPIPTGLAPPDRVATPVVRVGAVRDVASDPCGWTVPIGDLTALVATAVEALPGGREPRARPELPEWLPDVGAARIAATLRGWLG